MESPWTRRNPNRPLQNLHSHKKLPLLSCRGHHRETILYRRTREDIQANITLLNKTGDIQDPNNYRPITLLNTDYKITTKVINTVAKNAVGHVIPEEQMSRTGVCGTMQALLCDKAITEMSRLRR
ncbi:hypothetical protein Zmor_023665 [Zophobas morio]|uniref:Uncharacterized protein n=1 Tax=Zophobas morio TaxID=2755281 RepID=A0AA38HZ12_9CUCU|nr:hypothetical protein Zmor_023665 [Zophobas morio]